MSVVTIRDSADRMAEDLDRRFRNVFVIVGRTGLAEIPQMPWDLLTSLNVQLGSDTSQLTKQNKRCIGAGAAPTKYRIIGFRGLRHDIAKVLMNDPVHRTIERLASLDSAKVNPSPSA